MEFHLGRLIDHVHLRVADLETSKQFYRAILRSVGSDITMEGDHFFTADELFFSADGDPTVRVHLAFQTDGAETVRRFHDAGLAAGGKDNGPPGERRYHPGYYSAYVLDPDGNNIEAVYHGPAQRSAPSIVVKPGG